MAAVEILMHFLTLLVTITRSSCSVVGETDNILAYAEIKLTIMWNTNLEMTSESLSPLHLHSKVGDRHAHLGHYQYLAACGQICPSCGHSCNWFLHGNKIPD
jgi:hypothetical protein